MTTQIQSNRIVPLDWARGIALVAMAIYHFVWDLELFGFVAQGTAGNEIWKPFARSIAFSFLLLVGVSLVMAHRSQFNSKSFLRRLAMIMTAALVITIATYFATPESYIFFGILHHIAFATVIGLAVLQLPAALAFLIAFLCWAAWFFGQGIIDIPALAFLGLNATNLASNDFVPVFPWFGAVCLGIALGKAFNSQITSLSSVTSDNPLLGLLAIFGRNSLLFYLVHQPILIGLVYVAAMVVRA